MGEGRYTSAIYGAVIDNEFVDKLREKDKYIKNIVTKFDLDNKSKLDCCYLCDDYWVGFHLVNLFDYKTYTLNQLYEIAQVEGYFRDWCLFRDKFLQLTGYDVEQAQVLIVQDYD